MLCLWAYLSISHILNAFPFSHIWFSSWALPCSGEQWWAMNLRQSFMCRPNILMRIAGTGSCNEADAWAWKWPAIFLRDKSLLPALPQAPLTSIISSLGITQHHISVVKSYCKDGGPFILLKVSCLLFFSQHQIMFCEFRTGKIKLNFFSLITEVSFFVTCCRTIDICFYYNC